MIFSCSQCQTTLRAEPDMAGKVITCPACRSRLQVPGTPVPKGSKSKSAASSEAANEDPINVNSWLGLLIGLGAMAVVVLFLYFVKNTFIGIVYFSGGWVNHLEFIFFFWGLGILALKLRKIARQKSALVLDILPTNLGQHITSQNVHAFINHLQGLPDSVQNSLMVSRIRKGLELFAARDNNSEVGSLLSAQSDIDANRIGSSYNLTKVFLWAIPILGFIGTVLGLSFAMAGFGQADLTNMDSLKDSVTAITSGLATAFNTTLLGLILSMLLIFPMSSIQKREEDCLTDIDSFCYENLIPRLHGSDDGGPESALDPQITEAYIAQLQQTTEAMQSLTHDLTQVTRDHFAAIEEKSHATLEQANERVSSALERSLTTTSAYFEGLEKGIRSLNLVLGQLSGEKIVIQQAPKKSWWKKG